MDLQFSCSINNATAREALKDYAVTLQKLYQQYQNLWESHIMLQEIHGQCNTNFSSEVVANQINELTPQKRKKSDDLSTITDKFYMNSPNNNINMLSDLNNTPPKSPIFPKRCLKTVNSSMKKLKDSSQNIETSVPKCYKKLGISTTTNIETTFLPNGKKLKQSELIFQAVKPDKKNIDKHKSINFEPNIKPKTTDNDALLGKATLISTDDTVNTEEIISQDVIELSPTQRSVKFNVKDLLKDKKKFRLGQRVKTSSNKNKYYTPGLNMESKASTAHNSIDSTTYNQVGTHKFLIEDLNAVDTLKENRNPSDLLSLHKYNDRYKEVQKKNQEICQSSKNSTQESVFLSIQNPAYQEQTDSFNFDDTNNAENKSPIKRRLFSNSNTSPKTKKDDYAHFRTECKTERTGLKGHDCWECETYYQNLPLQKKDLQKRKNQCSRHKHKYPKPRSPEGFWNPEFSDSILSPH